MSDEWRSSYDAWKTRPPEMSSVRSGEGSPHVCDRCQWTGRGQLAALAHHRATHHPVRGRDWPRSWGAARFECCPNCSLVTTELMDRR